MDMQLRMRAGGGGRRQKRFFPRGETFVESIPLWLIDKSNSDKLERQQAQRLSALMGDADRVVEFAQVQIAADQVIAGKVPPPPAALGTITRRLCRRRQPGPWARNRH